MGAGLGVGLGRVGAGEGVGVEGRVGAGDGAGAGRVGAGLGAGRVGAGLGDGLGRDGIGDGDGREGLGDGDGRDGAGDGAGREGAGDGEGRLGLGLGRGEPPEEPCDGRPGRSRSCAKASLGRAHRSERANTSERVKRVSMWGAESRGRGRGGGAETARAEELCGEAPSKCGAYLLKPLRGRAEGDSPAPTSTPEDTARPQAPLRGLRG